MLQGSSGRPLSGRTLSGRTLSRKTLSDKTLAKRAAIDHNVTAIVIILNP